MNVLGIIPARGGSKRLKNKNIIELSGKPLIGYTIEAALDANSIDHVVVSTDSDRIADTVKAAYDVEVIMRPDEFARDDSPIEEALLHAVEYMKKAKGYKTDIVVWMHANVPTRKQGTIDETIKKLVSSDADSCVTCYEADQIPEAMKNINDQGRLVPLVKDVKGIRKQEFPKRYLLDGSVVALRAKNLYETRGIRKSHVYLGKEVIPVIHEERKYTLEVDVPDDVSIIKYFMQNK